MFLVSGLITQTITKQNRILTENNAHKILHGNPKIGKKTTGPSGCQNFSMTDCTDVYNLPRSLGEYPKYFKAPALKIGLHLSQWMEQKQLEPQIQRNKSQNSRTDPLQAVDPD